MTDLTPDQTRRAIRGELHAIRCADHDHSEERYYTDARELDMRLAEMGIEHERTTWSRQFEQRQGGSFPVTRSTITPSDDSECQPTRQKENSA